ncbi:hypothetical protein [Algoriphagus mannitolivorans]|uniref:hypothetical protein n=1 Tax=Algoriphagus mannitolivorans TaxID=226504 RepID=UPI0003FA9FBC|nr:hypothetical protein [Algoriphagus mannitolivorans]
MKVQKFLLSTLLVALFISVSFASQPTLDEKYFEGKWAVTVKDTPQGTATIPMRFETVDGVTKGYFMEDASGNEKIMSSVSISGDVLTAYFNITGYDVYMSLKKVDDESANGSLMDMFTAEAKRMK